MIVEVAKARAGMPANVKKIVVKPSPLKGAGHTTVSAGQQIIVLPSNILQQISDASKTVAVTTRKVVQPQPAKIIVPASALKRESVSDLDSEDGQPARKRANLDHLTPEEKLMRRKLKNRVAAQNARDKKRVRMDEMEAKMRELEEINAKLLMENDSLRALNERLSSSSSVSFEVPSPVTPCPATPDLPPLSDYGTDHSDRASSPGASSSYSSSDCSLVDSRSFESAELINASQQKSQDRGWAGLWTAVMATMAPAAFCLAAAAAATSSPSSSPLPSLPNKETLSSKPLDTTPTSTKPVLPIKKRLIQTKEPPTT